MSMYRQLWLAIITAMLLALGGGLLASMVSARSYLESQLTFKNNDNATALALALSASNPDATMIELTVASLFDGGHYEWIRVVDPLGRVLVEKVSPAGDIGAPNWFVYLLPIAADSGRAQISNGWQQVGVVSLLSHSKFAYGALWKTAYEIVVALTLAGLLGGYLGAMVLRRLRRPLNAVIGQANAITQRRFVTIEEPEVPELRQLAIAMNATVGRLKTMFEEEAARLDVMRREANCDALTGLLNRPRFMAGLQQSLNAEDASGGTLMLVRLADLSGINRRLGRVATDDFLRRAGAAIGECVLPFDHCLAARLNGSDFSLLLPADLDARAMAEQLLDRLIEVAAPFSENEPAAWIAMGGFERDSEMEALLARVDLALAGAQAGGVPLICEATTEVSKDMPRTSDQWARMIPKALEHGWVRLVSFPVVETSGKLSHNEHVLRIKFGEDDEWLAAGRFLPIAERLKLTPALDLAAVTLGLKVLESTPDMPGLAINLSASSVADAKFTAGLLNLVDANLGLAPRLWLEVAEVGALRNKVAFRALFTALAMRGCRTGLEHVGNHISHIGELHDIGLDYLKVDSVLIRNIDQNPGNQAFLRGLCTISQNMGMVILAEGVLNQDEAQCLKSLGFTGMTGPGIVQG